jgi:O-antigen/teichoic acid export membrane protein
VGFNRFGREIFIYGGTDLIFRGAQFLILPIYVGALSLAEFGQLALLQASTTLLGMLLNLGANNAVQRHYFDSNIGHDRRPAVVTAGLAQLLISVCVGVGILITVGWTFWPPLQIHYGITWPLIVLALANIIPEQIAQYLLDAVRLQFTPMRFVCVAFVKNLLGLASSVYFLLVLDLGIEGILLGTLLGSTLAVPIGLAMIRSNLARQLDLGLMRRLLKFGLPFVLAGAAYWVFGSIDRWMLAEMSTIEEVGLFSIAFKFAGVISVGIAAFGQAWSPFAYQLSSENVDYRRAFSQVFSIWFFGLAFLAFVVSVFASDILRWITPQEYWASAPMLAVGVCGIALFGTSLVSTTGLVIQKMPMRLTVAAWVAAVTNVVTNLALIPIFGGIGAAFSTLIAYSVLAGLLLFWSQRFHPLPIKWLDLSYSTSLLVVATTLAATNALGVGPGWTVMKLLLCLLAAAGAGIMRIISIDTLEDLIRPLRMTFALLPSGNLTNAKRGGE